MIAPEPVFVDRRTQLQLFDDVLTALAYGDRRHIALLGLRRIGKTTLLDEVRRRHQGRCIPMLPVDAVVSTPEQFALEVMAEVLEAACAARGLARRVTTQPLSITTAAALLGEALPPVTEELLELVAEGAYGRLLSRTFRFPGEVSATLDMPILVILDEFQDLRRLRHFQNTDNLWGAFRDALDRRGKVAFAVSGSIVTVIRHLLHQGNDPLFTRFREIELPPFEQGDTQELATGMWERTSVEWTQNAVQRLHALSQGFPFYVHTLALAAADLARPETVRVDGEHVDAAFEIQILDRNSVLSIYCQYLYSQAIGDVRGENIPDAVLRQVAFREGITRAEVARELRRIEGAAQIYRVVGDLIEIDILADQGGGLWFVDPVLPVWVALERERRDPVAVLSNPQARAKVLGSQAERLRALQEALGETFEKRVHNALRQFRGQDIPGRLFGVDGRILLPEITDVRDLELPDPEGYLSGRPGSVEIDAVATGRATWVVECKYRAGGVTAAQVERFARACRFYEEQTGRTVDARWYLSQTGFRAEARERCASQGIYASTTRDLKQLERIL